MITDLRWVEREDKRPFQNIFDANATGTIKVLQAYDGHHWVDVPTVKED